MSQPRAGHAHRTDSHPTHMTDPGTAVQKRDFRLLVGVISAGALVSIAGILLSLRFLYADAAYFLIGMWERESFFILNPRRWLALGASQWLPALAMQLGWRSPRGVALLYGANLWLNPVLAVAGVWLASGRSREITLATAVAALLLFQTTSAFVESEATVLFCIAAVWVVATVRRDFPLWLLMVLALLPFTHESYVLVLAPVLSILLVRRARYREHYGVLRYRALVAVMAGVTAFQFLPALGPTPADDFAARNQGYFFGGAVSLPGSPALVLTTIAFGAVLVSAWRPGLRWPTPVFWTSLALLVALPFALPGAIWPFYHYRARILHSAASLVLFAYLHARFVWGGLDAPRVPVVRLAALALGVFVVQARTTLEWRRHLELFRDELTDARGIVAFPVEGQFAELRARQFEWSWTTPVRSILFQAMETGEVRAIMLNADTTIWQPFDPGVAEELPELSSFGVRYAPEVLGPSASSGGPE